MAMASSSSLGWALVVLTVVLAFGSINVSGWATSCGDPKYKKCYGVVHHCPPGCPKLCEMDCYLCKPICPCDKPGAVCQDPRFIGGDGIMFYFHGKTNADFCLLSDPHLHINAHFIGKPRLGAQKKARDFTWVQSVSLLFGQHQLVISAQKTASWDDLVDRLSLSFDQQAIDLAPLQDAQWSAPKAGLSVTRKEATNLVLIEKEKHFRITVRVVPITAEESRVHNYGITQEDCFAHLEINFKFFLLSPQVTGVLGQTYAPGYRSPVKIGVPMPILGGEPLFAVSSLSSSDCKVSKFNSNLSLPSSAVQSADMVADESRLASVTCSGGRSGSGIVCRR